MQTSASSHHGTRCGGRRGTTCHAARPDAHAPRRGVLLGGASLLAGGGLLRPGGALADALAAAPPDASRRLERQLEQRVSRFELGNGMRFVVVARPSAPVVSINTYCSTGAWVERDGQTGIAHLLEHLAFKGTPRIGSQDWGRESGLLSAMDEVFCSLRDARASGREAEAARLAGRLEALQEEAQALVVPNAFAQALTSAGAVNLNAATSHDSTKYYVSLPSNQLELWFALEAERFQAPVFREFYREKQVVAEERASRIDNSPAGAVFYEFAQRALSNGYRRPVLGYKEDLDAMGRGDVAEFFARHYHPRNLTVAIAGAADPEDVRRLAERYFGGWAAPDGAAVVAPTPQQLASEPSARPGAARGAPAAAAAERAAAAPGGSGRFGALAAAAALAGGGGGESKAAAAAAAAAAAGAAAAAAAADAGAGAPAVLDYATSSRAGPLALVGYYRPSLLAPGPSGAALEAACDVLAGGRTARLTRLALGGRLLAAAAAPDYPGDLHAGLALVSAVPRPGESPLRAAALCQQELDRLAASGPSAPELGRVKKAARMELLAALQSNAGLAGALATYEAVTGSWRSVLEELARVEGLTAGDVRDAAAATFDPANSVTALVSSSGRNGAA